MTKAKNPKEGELEELRVDLRSKEEEGLRERILRWSENGISQELKLLVRDLL